MSQIPMTMMKTLKKIDEHRLTTDSIHRIITTFHKVIEILVFTSQRGVVRSYRNFILFEWNLTLWDNRDHGVVKVPDKDGLQSIIFILFQNLNLLCF